MMGARVLISRAAAAPRVRIGSPRVARRSREAARLSSGPRPVVL